MPLLIILVSMFCTALNPHNNVASDEGVTTSVNSVKGDTNGDFIIIDDTNP
jgi:hypothetical protein